MARAIRRLAEVPIIMLTTRSAEEDRGAGLRLGADDYLVKPFSVRELAARVEAVLRRSARRGPADVTDPGPGITEDELPHVFDRFYRGWRARSNGSGIGLAGVLELVQAHGGQVTVSSAPGRAASVRVTVPLLEVAGERPQAVPEAARSGGGR